MYYTLVSKLRRGNINPEIVISLFCKVEQIIYQIFQRNCHDRVSSSRGGQCQPHKDLAEYFVTI